MNKKNKLAITVLVLQLALYIAIPVAAEVLDKDAPIPKFTGENYYEAPRTTAAPEIFRPAVTTSPDIMFEPVITTTPEPIFKPIIPSITPAPGEDDMPHVVRPVTPAPAIVKGDADGDGVLTKSDALFVLEAIVNDDYLDPAVYDMNGDGVVNVLDAIEILKLIA